MERGQIIECVPNFSEGRDLDIVEYITGAFRDAEGVRLLDYSSDADHNRMVVTASGEPSFILSALLEAVSRAIESIDMNRHSGVHPRTGAIDVVPFIPIRGITMREAASLSENFARTAAERFSLPVYLYEHSARTRDRAALENIRRGGYENLEDKMGSSGWAPDFGPGLPHPTAGIMVTGARTPLIAFNVNLKSTDIKIARDIARRIRASSGGLPCLKAIGVELSRDMVQVSMNLTDYTRTGIFEAYEAVRREAARHGVELAESELIGLVPALAMAEAAARFVGLEGDMASRILELMV